MQYYKLLLPTPLQHKFVVCTKFNSNISLKTQTMQLHLLSVICRWLFAPAHLWLLTCDSKLKFRPQTLQLYGFSPVWTLMCLFKVPFSLKRFPQNEQLKGLSPVWLLKCIANVFFWLKLLLHTEQLNGFSPVWLLIWVFKLAFVLKLLVQTVQVKGFSPVWLLMWACRFPLHPNCLSQTVQLNGLSHDLWWLTVLSFFSVSDSCSLISFHSSLLSSLSDSQQYRGSSWSLLSVSVSMLWAELLARCSASLFASICPWWSASSSSFSLFTVAVVTGKLVISASSGSWSCSTAWVIQTSSCSSLMCSFGSSWSRLFLHSSCSSFLTISFWPSRGKTEIQIKKTFNHRSQCDNLPYIPTLIWPVF